jgi:hypothetical protein
MRVHRSLALTAAIVAGALGPAPATASHDAADHSQNMHLLGNSPRTTQVSQSDLAFWGRTLFAGNYEGFRVLDIADPEAPIQLADVRCNGAQNDVSVWGDLVFLSVDRPQTAPECSTDTPGNTPGWEGIRVFDAGDRTAPEFLTAVATDCGSHTHTLLPDLAQNRLLLYVSSYPSSPTTFGDTPYGTSCERLTADGGQGHSKISVVEVPLDAPEDARVVGEPTIELSDFRDTPGYRGCHDIQVFTALEQAAAACLSEGQLWDISDPEHPRTTRRVFNAAVDIWHSAAFTWDGEIVIFGDEFAGGGGPGCTDPSDNLGRVWFYDRASGGAPLGSYKIPRPQGSQICTMHNFNVIPTRKGYTLVAASNFGGTTVVDFTDPADAREIAYYDADGSPWSSYWYNGFIYANDRLRGVDVFLLSDRARAGARKFPYMNPQTQEQLIGR